MIRLGMKNCNMILRDKQQEISALLSVKTDNYEYLSGEEILLPDKSRILAQVKYTCHPLKKTFEKQIRAIEQQEIKQIDATTNQK